MTTPEAPVSPELSNGQYTDLHTLHSELNFIGSQGVEHVILAIDKTNRRAADGTPNYGYILKRLGDFPGSPPLSDSSNPEAGKMLVGDAAFDTGRVSHHGWITEAEFARGARVKIVVNPQEIGEMEFSWDGGGNCGRARAVEKMEFVKDLLLIF